MQYSGSDTNGIFLPGFSSISDKFSQAMVHIWQAEIEQNTHGDTKRAWYAIKAYQKQYHELFTAPKYGHLRSVFEYCWTSGDYTWLLIG